MPSRASSNSHLGSQNPPLSHSIPFIQLSMTLRSMECPFGQFRLAVPAVSTPSLLPTSSLLAWGKAGGREESLDAVQAVPSNSQNISAYLHWFSHTPKTQHHNPSQPEPVSLNSQKYSQTLEVASGLPRAFLPKAPKEAVLLGCGAEHGPCSWSYLPWPKGECTNYRLWDLFQGLPQGSA